MRFLRPVLPAHPGRSSCSRALVYLALVAAATAAAVTLPDAAAAQSRSGSRASTGRSVRSVPSRGSGSARAAVRATRGRASTVRGVPTTPDGIWRLPALGSDRSAFGEDVLLRPFTPRGAPIVEWIPGDPFDRDGFRRDGRHRDRDGRDRFRRERRRSGFDGFDRGCDDAGLRVRVGPGGVSVGVGGRDGRRDGFRCASRHGGIVILPAGTTYYGAYHGGTSDASDGYHAENANGAAFSGGDRPGYGATGCAAVTVRLRGGEWYGGLVRLPALDAGTPEALAAALRTRHRHGRSTMLKGFEGNNLAVPAGPGVEGVDVEPCF